MICRQSRMMLIDRELGSLDPEAYAALHRHLQGCAACRVEAQEGERLRDDLTLLRGEAPFEIDVRSRVLARVAELGPPAADELSLRQQALYAAAALLGGIVILGSLWDLLPGFVEPARGAIAFLSGVGGVVASLAAPIGDLLAIPFKLLWSLLGSIGSMASLVERVAPLGAAAAAAVALLTGTMSVTVVYFVGRDLLARPLREES